MSRGISAQGRSPVAIIPRKLVASGVEGVGFALPIETALKELGISVEGE